MFRSVLIIIFVIVILLLIRTVTQRLKLKQPQRFKAFTNRDMVQCLQCGVYIPSEEAITNGSNSFCSQRHLDDWNRST